VGERSEDEEVIPLKCHVCGAALVPVTTDLPFKLGGATIVIVKALPVLQCESCSEYALEDEVMRRVDEILERADPSAELEIIRYAA
jgi:YgiT-type zinc finger domain-containing protein